MSTMHEHAAKVLNKAATGITIYVLPPTPETLLVRTLRLIVPRPATDL